MNIQNNLFGLCSKPNSKNERELFDLQSLINKLLLFDKFILYSPNLYEVSHIAYTIGLDDTLTLLSSGALKLCPELRLVGQVAQTEGFDKVLPLGHYRIMYGYAHSREEWISKQLQNIRVQGLKHAEFKRLKLAVVNAFENNFLQDSDSEFLRQTNEDLAHGRGLKKATSIALSKIRGIDIESKDFSIKLHQVGDQDFKVETNLSDLLNLDEIETHKIVESAVLGVASLNQRIAEMKIHNAISGFLEDESPLFGDKLEFILQSDALNPNIIEKNFARVLQIREFPVIVSTDSQRVNIDRLFEVRKSQDFKAFREWIKEVDNKDDSEIIEMFNDIRSKLGIMAQGGTGKVTRFLVSTLAGFTGVLPGLGLGILDSFILEKVLPYSGVVAFMDKLYPSIFQKQKW
jgi:hypothetical protein